MAAEGASSTKDLANLDLIRAMAVLFVVASHVVPYFTSGERLFHWQALGILGVAIFFVHTCLVLMYSLDRQRQRSGNRYFSTAFYLRRFFRIYPLSVLVVILVFALPAVRLAPEVPHSLGTLLSDLLLVQNITGHSSVPAVLWSLPCELQMYLVLPLIFLWVRSDMRRGSLRIGTLWLGSALLIALAGLAHWDYRLVRYVPCFLPGILAFTLADRVRPRLPFWVLPATLVAFGSVFPVLVKLGLSETMLAWPACLILGCLIPLARPLAWEALATPARIIAKYSYGLYLTHTTVIWVVMNRVRGSSMLRLAIFFMAEAALVTLLYRLVEYPGIRLGARWTARWLSSAEPESRPSLPAA